MSFFIVVFLLMVLVMIGMAVGVMNGREPLSGSCGGIKRLGLGTCEICGDDPAKCESESGPASSARRSVSGASPAYDIMDSTRKK